MSSKTIEINPSLFSVGGLSKKNRSKKNKSMSAPLISPNVLKNKLLKRIKEHKNKETKNLDSKKPVETGGSSNSSQTSNTNTNINSYTDEFNDSIEYLQTLSKQKKTETENNIKRNAIQRKTIKSYSSMPSVSLELPDELKETFITVNNEINTPTISSPVSIKNTTNDVPYGILKGGNKPTYRQWNKTQKNYQPVSNNFVTNAPISERESRLNLLKQKLKQQTTILNQPPTQQFSQPIQVITQPLHTNLTSEISIPTQVVNQQNLEDILLTQNLIQNPNQNLAIPQNIITSQNTDVIEGAKLIGGSNLAIGTLEKEPEKIRTTKKLLKKTIHKKYTLGKSKIKRTVGVLLKDKNTRKNVINAQKDLRDKSVNDVKTYLRHHNLIKIGSNAPNDVIRKIYESAMLAGEITNNNKDTMIHNFIKDDT
jgi:hypothetical protein